MYQIVYSPKALNEYELSIIWYAERSITAAENFVKTVSLKVNLIKQNPTSFKNKYRHFYEAKLHKFPFTIIYFIDDNIIVITAIYHHKRNPKKKYL